MNREQDDANSGGERLAAHASQCDECHRSPLPLADITRALVAYGVSLDAAALSRRVGELLRPELARLASAWFWRRVAKVTLAALVPLPAILLLDAYVLRAFYGWASTLLPAALATYLVVSYAAAQLLLFAATYAAIPLVLARDAWFRAVAPAEATS